MSVSKFYKKYFNKVLKKNNIDIKKISYIKQKIDKKNLIYTLKLSINKDLNEKKVKKVIENSKSGLFKSKDAKIKVIFTKNIKIIKGDFLKDKKIKNIDKINSPSKSEVIKGELFQLKIYNLKNGSNLIIMYVSDGNSSITIKFFENNRGEFSDALKEGNYYKFEGKIKEDEYEDYDLTMWVNSINQIPKEEKRKDLADKKRVELHLHTKMSSMDSILEIKKAIDLANSWGHKAIAITDHGVVQSFPKAYQYAKNKDIKLIYGLEGYLIEGENIKQKPYHITILAKNKKGLKNLYKLVSLSHIDKFHSKPKMNKKDINKYREGLIIGSACEAGELYQKVLNSMTRNEEINLEKVAEFYDYFEVQPLENNRFILDRIDIVKSFKQLEIINKKIYQLSLSLDKLCVATGDVHFLNPKDKIYREIIQSGQGYSDFDKQPPLHLKTTNEMLKDFDYFTEKVQKELVIKNPNKLVEEIENIDIIPDKLFTPKIKNGNKKIKKLSYQKAKKLYGEKLHPKVKKRIKKELTSIINNGFEVVYLISKQLVDKSLEDGYLVGSRGSVGSSLIAYLLNITEVNPLSAHYRCDCGYTEFVKGEMGVDLKDKNCPKCDKKLIKDGFDIPFEVFLGFKGEKVPDIDLNFSGQYQDEVHKYTKEIFGEENVYRAGTISTLANRLAYGFVKGWDNDNNKNLRKAEIQRLTNNCTGIKKTTGQHPGGQIIVPKEKEIYDFTPIQKPANDMKTKTLTTHFDFHAIDNNLLKLDILGHDDPTSLKMLKDLTGVDPLDIPLDDKDTFKLFKSSDILNISLKDIGINLGTLAVPEFNTEFTRSMLKETNVKSFADLIRISGLSHGSNVWLNNAQNLIKKNVADISQVISVRDDIMNYLIAKGIKNSTAFNIMEKVRKGKGITKEEIKLMKEKDIPKWYINSCKKIKYMFPKAHATAYVIMAYRIAWYKINFPLEFYATYFSRKSEHFEIKTVIRGKKEVLSKINYFKSIQEDDEQSLSVKNKQVLKVLFVAYEALKRGIKFLAVDIYKSKLDKFIIKNKKLLPPLTTVDNMGKSASLSLVKTREKMEFEAIDEISKNTSINNTAIECLKEIGSLDDLPDEMQMNIFEI